jgi:uracil-DNA glycosylase family 4
MSYVPGKGPIGAKLAIVGESPSYEEVQAGTAFVGPSGKELDRICRDAGFRRDDCWVTNVCKYFVPASGKKIPFTVRAQQAGINIHQCLDELRTELSSIQPNCILGLGGTALWALTGKSKKIAQKKKENQDDISFKPAIQAFRGSILFGMGSKVVCSYHPAHLLHQEGEIKGYWNRQVMVFDFKRAWYQSKFKELNLPARNLYICQNSHQLLDFITRHKHLTRPAVDIEAIDCIPACIGLAFTPHEGITVPLWNVKGISTIDDSEMCSLWRILSDFLYREDIIGQNFGYDRDKIKRLGFIIKRLISDTMMKAFAINPELPKNLAFNTSIYTEEPYYKDEGMYEGPINDLFIGCARDSCVTKEIDLKMDVDLDELQLRPFYENFLMQLPPLYSWIESIGFNTNEQIREQLLRKYIAWSERLNYQLFQIAGTPINVNSPKQVATFLYESFKIPTRVGTGEEVLTQILNNVKLNEIQRAAIELTLEKRRVDKTTNNYLLSPADYDGRTRTSYFLCLETGRSSTNQLEPPIRPYQEVISYHTRKKKKVSTGSAFQTETKHGDIGSDIRSRYQADEGEIFLQADSSQAEARVIFMLAEDYEALELIDKCDYHALTASWFFGGTEDDYSKKVLGYESPIRFAGKTLRHAGHLGASKRRAAIEVNTQARKYKINYVISESQADFAIKIFHQKQPKIRQIYHNSVIECLQKTRMLAAPVPYGVDAPYGGKRTFFERWNDELFRQAFAYLPQRTVSENTKGAALRIHARAPWIKIIVESHDSLLTSVPIIRAQEAAPILKEEFERPIDFSRCSLPRGQLIIPCEIEMGFNYYELSKFKWITYAA